MQIVSLHKSVVVQEHQRFSSAFTDTPIAGMGQSLLDFHDIMEVQGRISLPEPLALALRMVRAVVVHQHDFKPFRGERIPCDMLERPVDVLLPVVGADDDGNFNAHGNILAVFVCQR